MSRLGSFFTNMFQPMPVGRKLRLALRNNWLKVRRLDDCCRQPGQPGCCEKEERPVRLPRHGAPPGRRR